MDYFSLIFVAMFGAPIVRNAYQEIKKGTERIARVPFYGTIKHASPSDSMPPLTTPKGLEIVLKRIEKNPKYKGLILDISSGGGEAGASHEIYDILRNFKLPKVAWVSSISASGAYMAASACNSIVVAPESIIGSIGVIMKKPVLKELMEKIGVKYEIIKSGKHKDGLSMHRELTEEEMNILQEIVDANHKVFVDLVYETREGKIEREALEKFATGQVTYGEKAKKIGLVDKIGTFSDAVGECESLGCFKASHVDNIAVNTSFFKQLIGGTGKLFGKGFIEGANQELEKIISEKYEKF